MKTADLIPLILLELNECDKYGFELTKSIETKSKGKIIIKQPTLYTILKKLEKSKFISSYWQDSDIGGKRHYYKITDNGRLQVSTLPSYEKLINNIISEDTDNQNFFVPNNDYGNNYAENSNNGYQSVSIMDSIMSDDENIDNSSEKDDNINSIGLQESILPSQEVFESSNIDNATELEINQSNTEILKSDKVNTEEKFAENKDVSKFTEKESTIISDEYKNQFIQDENKSIVSALDENNELDYDAHTYSNVDDESYRKIKYVDYIDFKTNPNYIYAKNTAKNMKNKILATTVYLFVMILISSIVTTIQGNAKPIYYIFFLIALGVMIFYPSIYAGLYDKFRLHLQNNKYEPDLKKQLYISLAIELLIITICIIVNINIGNNSIQKMFSLSNFANLYAPIIMSTVIFADILFGFIFMKRNKK